MTSRTPLGAKLTVAGGALLLTSLWLPWYQIQFPQAFRDALRGLSGGGTATQPAQGLGGAVNAVVSGLASAIPDTVNASGWQAMKGGDVALAVIVGLVALLVTRGLGMARIDDAARAQAIAGLGLVAVGIVGFHVVRRPFGDLPGFVESPHLRYGMAMALIGSVLIGAGGHLLGRDAGPERWIADDRLKPAPGQVPADDGAGVRFDPPAGTSVAPPGLG